MAFEENARLLFFYTVYNTFFYFSSARGERKSERMSDILLPEAEKRELHFLEKREFHFLELTFLRESHRIVNYDVLFM